MSIYNVRSILLGLVIKMMQIMQMIFEIYAIHYSLWR